MEISKLSEEEQKLVFDIANIAINTMEPSYELAFEEIEVENTIKAKSICSEFVNRFARKYDSKAKVKFMDEFIRDLQNVI